MASYVRLTPGDPAPWFHQRSFANPRYAFDSAAGRYIVLCFFCSAALPQAQAALASARSRPAFFDDNKACFFGISIDPRDETEGHVINSYPGYRFIWDFDRRASKLYGAVPREEQPTWGEVSVRPIWVVVDPTLRVMRVIEFKADQSDIAELLAFIDCLDAPHKYSGVELQAPILYLPDIFEPALCRKLIDLYRANGGIESGFMREVDGVTVGAHDRTHKSRKDFNIQDADVINATQARVQRKIIPEIAKVHQFKVTRMERYIVCCYAAEDGGHFRAHRDNTTKGTAHRRFAVSINLNDDFDGGEVSFPEYGSRRFKPPPGGAIVFSCSLLHAVSQVTRGRRYAFLPFLYDEDAARLREANMQFVGVEGAKYSSGLDSIA